MTPQCNNASSRRMAAVLLCVAGSCCFVSGIFVAVRGISLVNAPQYQVINSITLTVIALAVAIILCGFGLCFPGLLTWAEIPSSAAMWGWSLILAFPAMAAGGDYEARLKGLVQPSSSVRAPFRTDRLPKQLLCGVDARATMAHVVGSWGKPSGVRVGDDSSINMLRMDTCCFKQRYRCPKSSSQCQTGSNGFFSQQRSIKRDHDMFDRFNGAHRQHRAGCPTQNLLRHAPIEPTGKARATVGRHDN